MIKFTLKSRSGKEKVYEVEFKPWPTFNMCVALAKAILADKGGKSCVFEGPNGLFGAVEN